MTLKHQCVYKAAGGATVFQQRYTRRGKVLTPSLTGEKYFEVFNELGQFQKQYKSGDQPFEVVTAFADSLLPFYRAEL